MSLFLHNLIARHQAGGASRRASQIVQPRPKSRFETDSDAGTSQSLYESAIKPATGTDSEHSPQHPPVPPHHHTDTGNDNTAIGSHTDDVLKLTDALTLAPESIQQSNEPPDLARVPEQSHRQDLPITDELTPRVQSILHRLSSQLLQYVDHQSAAEPRQSPASSTTVTNTLTGSEELHLIPEATLESGIKDSVTMQNIENQSVQQTSHHSGLLQIPNWLTELQSDLNSRWREINTEAEPEPVVNVTIGRVEVRAVQADTNRQTETRSKPSGIMSLDDYLKRRNGEQA